AEWIAWQLEEAAFSVVIEAWDFRPGGNFALDMHRAASQSERTIAVFSPDFLDAVYVHPEWAAAFAQDPTGERRILVPVKVRECKPDGLLRQMSYIDLIGAPEDEAKRLLLEGVNRDRAKPATAPAFPRVAPAAIPERAIAERPNFPGAFPPVWRIPRELNPHFVGRDELLADIRQTLLAGQAAALTALHGMGGVGKTQLAAEYAYAHRANYEAVWWLNADTETTMANDLAAFARALDLPEKDAREIPLIVAAVLRWLSGNADWLLIYDNAPDAAAVRGFLPQARNGHVIVTSRDPNWRGLAQPLEVKTLDAAAGAQFLLERTGQTDSAAAEELAKELGGLPLALEQAGAYCEATGKSLADYLRLFRQRWQELLRRGKPDNYPATVATTWEISFEGAERECPAAAALLNLLAFCAPEELPLSVLRDGAKHLPDELAAIVADELAFEDAIAALRRYSLLTRRDDGVTLHRLVQLVARDRLPEAEQRRWAEAALLVVNEAFPFDSDDVRTWNVCAPLLPHAHAVTDFAETWQLAPETITRLANQMGLYFLGRAQYAEAKEIFEHALRLAGVALVDNHPDVGLAVNNLGHVLRELG
ncbi:MAG TPA: FxSxx-COOH system tetratricopeptide repeat protein, partial [Blastocatellia bacterium]|nr:FxSxx-COOH system tetratricopeptide repeat protein [Blastocatellia bacterium]